MKLQSRSLVAVVALTMTLTACGGGGGNGTTGKPGVSDKTTLHRADECPDIEGTYTDALSGDFLVFEQDAFCTLTFRNNDPQSKRNIDGKVFTDSSGEASTYYCASGVIYGETLKSDKRTTGYIEKISDTEITLTLNGAQGPKIIALSK